ncbi:hypothetical protein [Vibrio spartinae]|uniref:Lipoprotein n=1 Tax=Vibrio spartinae TaxID=1918945 RepID=A0A1N6MBN4_9VIBR|nr:hypothetical protein [Vibrio spartinae]QMV16960.1 hypothetical protein Vspart_04382 [Vibrio spartinae]SIO96834.1 hypothetical protein VSP9026_04659 [Vibrio spartinae]
MKYGLIAILVVFLSACSSTWNGVQEDSSEIWDTTKQKSSDVYHSTKEAIHEATAEE